jgi:hypothetical protein
MTNYQELGKAIEFAFDRVTPENLWNWRKSLLLLYLIFLRKAILHCAICQLEVVGWIEVQK